MGPIHRIGLVVGREWSFPPAFIDEVNGRDTGVVAEFASIGGTHHDEPVPYDVLVDRISHEVPMYRSYLKHAVLQGRTVVNNPFMWSADDKFFGASLITQLGVASPRTVLLGVDRLDYTKGIEVRLRAYRGLLEAGRVDPATTVFVQIAQPSRDEAPGYAETRASVEQMAGSINGDFSALGGAAVKYLHQGQDLAELVALYRAADVMVVTPFRDGMNLVAKEYVAAQVDLDGVLILSEFAGAAHQMRQAVLVNPFDVRGLEDAIDEAVNGDRRQHRRRMASLVRGVHRDDAASWAEHFLGDLRPTPTAASA